MPAAFLPGGLVLHAPALLVVIPLICGALAAMLPSPRAAWGLTLAACAFCVAASSVIVAQVLDVGAWAYAIGSWPPPLGIEYRIDALNAAVLLLVSVVALLCAIAAPVSANREIEAQSRPLFYAAFLICVCGLLGVAITGDAFNVFVFLEISSIASYALVAMGAGRDRRALRAAYDYLILGTIGATFFVIGIGFLYMATGTLNMADLAMRVQDLEGHRAVQAGFAFIVVGLGLKFALFPLHSWLPNAYSYAPTIVTAFLAATATKVALYVLIRFSYGVFDPDFAFAGLSLVALIAPLAALGMIAASLQALFQTDVRRLFAYSSVAQIGYMLLGVGIGGASGLSAGVLHLLNHALMKGAIFMALGAMWIAFGVTRVAELRGMGRTMPWTSAAFAIGGLSLIGVPGTAGFVSKWALLAASLEQGWWWAIAALAISSVLALLYVGRVLETMYLRPADEAVAKVRTSPLVLIPLWTLAGLNIVFGLWADFPVMLATRAATALLGPAP
jgi:multicomponent Na+:H+ antiporter subunit D